MKYLKIEEKKGLYWDGKQYKEIDKINKDDLLVLLNLAGEDAFELDPYNESLIGNRAHQIIYENIYNKLKQFLDNKNQFKKEVDKLYKEATSKYSTETTDESVGSLEIPIIEPESDQEESQIDVKDIPF